jgi:hypothetical protein
MKMGIHDEHIASLSSSLSSTSLCPTLHFTEGDMSLESHVLGKTYI